MAMKISDGMYTLQESENKNELFFFRNDGAKLSDVRNEPMDFYQAYVMQKMMDGEIEGVVINNLHWEMSDDETTLRVCIEECIEETKQEDAPRESEEEGSVFMLEPIVVRTKKQSFWNRLITKIFG